MADIYELLGIDWNATGFVNILGTSVGLLLLETPLLIFYMIAWWIASNFDE